ncbi:hypothetical protein BC831DRAFT_483051 [Entophlyctis helioformis]|nr:hypothetical protein BC831DRAFT_483051 [Entophlyctis helioformis]
MKKAKVNTRFPAARIKKIMRLDEDVGKVAQVTPHMISKAVELFLKNMVEVAAEEARQRNVKKLTVAHMCVRRMLLVVCSCWRAVLLTVAML